MGDQIDMTDTAANLEILTLSDALDCATAGDAGQRSPLSTQPFILLDTSGSIDEMQTQQLIAWIEERACPVIGLASEGDEWAVIRACDARVANVAEAAPLITNIQQSPIAATVLVQLLRLNARLPLLDALVAESLAYSTLQAGPEFKKWLDANRAAAPAAHSDSGDAVLVSRDGDVLSLELNRASNRNGMTVEMRDALVEALQLVVADDSITQVQISGRGKCFSTGGDLTEFGSAPDPATAHVVRSLALPGRLLSQCAVRVTVNVHGACIGSGIEFPAFASRMVATEDAYFQLPELKFGLIPGAGGTVSIARRIGRQRAGWLMLSGKRIDAQKALAWNLVDEVTA
ncbi:MAG: enoyl-CoA hydratase/isomerase family protein [Pseudomonadota bacterium]